MNLNATRSRAMALLLAVAVLLVFAPPSAAVIVDFQSLQAAGSAATFVSTYSEDGFLFVTSVVQNEFGSWQTGASGFAGSTGLFNNTPGATTTLTKIGGGAFDLTAVDLSLLDALQGAATVTFVGTTASAGTVTQSFNVTTFSFLPFVFAAFDDVVSVAWLQATQPPQGVASTFHQFDNLVIDQPLFVPGTVPEPATALVLACGLGAAATGVWRRRRG